MSMESSNQEANKVGNDGINIDDAAAVADGNGNGNDAQERASQRPGSSSSDEVNASLPSSKRPKNCHSHFHRGKNAAAPVDFSGLPVVAYYANLMDADDDESPNREEDTGFSCRRSRRAGPVRRRRPRNQPGDEEEAFSDVFAPKEGTARPRICDETAEHHRRRRCRQ